MGLHTPGPITVHRQVSRDGIVTQEIKQGNNTLGYTAFGNVSESECAANAQLWAAAPDMLAALKAIEAVLDGRQPIDVKGAVMVARSAIAKAEGK